MRRNILFLAGMLLLATTSCASKPNNASQEGATTTSTEASTSSEANTPAVMSDQPSQVIANVDDQHAKPAQVFNIDTRMSGHDAFEAIKKRYKGKVVLVDFWATWCPPCRAAMKDIDQIKTDLQKKGAVFVYITGETSPGSEWKASLQKISGDHYRLTDRQWSEIGNELNMPGIPAYMLLNKDGSVAFSNVTEGGYPGNAKIQNLMEVALTK